LFNQLLLICSYKSVFSPHKLELEVTLKNRWFNLFMFIKMYPSQIFIYLEGCLNPQNPQILHNIYIRLLKERLSVLAHAARRASWPCSLPLQTRNSDQCCAYTPYLDFQTVYMVRLRYGTVQNRIIRSKWKYEIWYDSGTVQETC